MFVTPSLGTPLSLAGVSTGAKTLGAIVSIVIAKLPETNWLPALSLACAEILWPPSARLIVEVIDQLPVLSAVVVPNGCTPSSNNVTLAPASLVPVNVGLVVFVRLSVFEMPVSLDAIRSGTVVVGCVVSITIESGLDTPTLPATSNTRAEIV